MSNHNENPKKDRADSKVIQHRSDELEAFTGSFLSFDPSAISAEELRDILMQVREELELESPGYEKLPQGLAKELARKSQLRIAAMSEEEKQKFLADWSAKDNDD